MKKLIALILTIILISGIMPVYANDEWAIVEWLENQPDITDNI